MFVSIRTSVLLCGDTKSRAAVHTFSMSNANLISSPSPNKYLFMLLLFSCIHFTANTNIYRQATNSSKHKSFEFILFDQHGSKHRIIKNAVDFNKDSFLFLSEELFSSVESNRNANDEFGDWRIKLDWNIIEKFCISIATWQNNLCHHQADGHSAFSHHTTFHHHVNLEQ